MHYSESVSGWTLLCHVFRHAAARKHGIHSVCNFEEVFASSFTLLLPCLHTSFDLLFKLEASTQSVGSRTEIMADCGNICGACCMYHNHSLLANEDTHD